MVVGHIVSQVTNARHHHLPSPACPYVEHLLLAGLRGKYSLCDPELTSGGGDDTTDNPPTQRINTSLVIVTIALKHF